MNDSTLATLQHIELLARKRTRLEEAQIEAEEQFCQETALRYARGEVTWLEVAAIYQRWRLAALPGFSRRWNEVLPIPMAGKAADR